MRFKRLRGILCQLNGTPFSEVRGDKLIGNTTNFSVTHNSLAALVLHLPLTRFMIWGALGIIAFLLQDFLGLAFGTYVLSYLGNSFVNLGTRHWPEYRRPVILAFFAGIALLVTTLFVWAIPSLVHEATDVAFRLQSEDPYVLVGAKLRQLLGDQVCGQLEVFLKMVAAASEEAPNMILAAGAAPPPKQAELGLMVKSLVEKHASELMVGLKSVLGATTRVTVQVIVAFVFSFMILWDLPRITRGMSFLKETRLKTAYLEAAPLIRRFGNLVGKALQAQALIAVVNTTMTAVGIKVLAIPYVGFLSGIVFVCSFIPVLGVALSSVPIGYLALVEKGPVCLLLSIAMILLVHSAEAYIFNPQIYSKTLKLHPLLALMVLVIAEHSMGIFGLLIAVPLTVFIVEDLVKLPEKDPVPASVTSSPAKRAESEPENDRPIMQ